MKARLQGIEPSRGVWSGKVRPQVALGFALGLAILLATQPARGCSCVGGRAWAQEARDASVIIVGAIKSHGSAEMSVHVERTLRGAVGPEVTVIGDRGMDCVPYVSNFPVGTSWVFALYELPTPGLYTFGMCAEGWLIAIGDRAFGNLTDKGRVHGGKGRAIGLESLPVGELLQLLEKSPAWESCTDDGDELLGTRLRGFHAPVPAGPLRPIYDRDCTSEEKDADVRLLVDERGFVRRVRFATAVPQCAAGPILTALRQRHFAPATQAGAPVGALHDVRVPLPYVAPSPSCGSRNGVREQTLIWVRDGTRNVITTVLRAEQIDEIALRGVEGLMIRPVPLGRIAAKLDLATAPKLWEYRDDPPCDRQVHDGYLPIRGRPMRLWSAWGSGACVSWVSGDTRCPPHTLRPLGEDSGRTDAAAVDAVRLEFHSPELVFDPAMFRLPRGDYILIFVTPEGGVEPATERMITPPWRPILPAESAESFATLWRDYLGEACREPRAVVIENQVNFAGCGNCFDDELPPMEQLVELGAQWLATPGAYNVMLTRLRMVTGKARQAPLALMTARTTTHLLGQFSARHDAEEDADCPKAVDYRRRSNERRAEEAKTLRAVVPEITNPVRSGE